MNNQCHAEKAMLRCKSKDRKQLRKSFIDKRKFFNREVQRSKRKFIMQKQADIDNLESSNPNLFWKEIGKIGIGQERRKTIPMEIIKPDARHLQIRTKSSENGKMILKLYLILRTRIKLSSLCRILTRSMIVRLRFPSTLRPQYKPVK